ncbi:MAG: hypothetical protein LBT59_09350, partial [Clostridiales bacterium]|nr:hypothetical protein [Clostridiales bacterium]
MKMIRKRFLGLLLAVVMMLSSIPAMAEEAPPPGLTMVRDICSEFGIDITKYDAATRTTHFAKDGLSITSSMDTDNTAVLSNGAQSSYSLPWVIFQNEAWANEDELLMEMQNLGFYFAPPEGTIWVRELAARLGIEIEYSPETGPLLVKDGVAVAIIHDSAKDELELMRLGNSAIVYGTVLSGRTFVREGEFLAALESLGMPLQPEGFSKLRDICSEYGITIDGFDADTRTTYFTKEVASITAKMDSMNTAVLSNGIMVSYSIPWIIINGETWVNPDELLMEMQSLGFYFVPPEGTEYVRVTAARYGISVDYSHEMGAMLVKDGKIATINPVPDHLVHELVLKCDDKTVTIYGMLLAGRTFIYEEELLAALESLGFELGTQAVAGYNFLAVERGVVPKGAKVLVRAEYSFNASAASGFSIAVALPQGWSYEQSMSVDGASVIPTSTTSGFNVSPGRLTGVLRFYVSADTAVTGNISAKAIVSGSEYDIGQVSVVANAITLVAATETSRTLMSLSGMAQPGIQVTVMRNGSPVGHATANLAGFWEHTDSLGTPANRETFTYIAKLPDGAESEPVTAIYSESFPEIDKITMIHNGASIVINKAGLINHYVYSIDYPSFTFVAELVEPETQLEGLAIIVTDAAGVETSVQAVYDSGKKAWIASRDFGIAEIPVRLRARYSCKLEIDRQELETSTDPYLSYFGSSIYSSVFLESSDLVFGSLYPSTPALRSQKGIFGLGWIFPYDASACLAKTSEGNVVAIYSHNGLLVLEDEGNGLYRETIQGQITARVDSSGSIEVTSDSGVSRFGTNGKLFQTLDSNGRGVTLTFSEDGLPVEIRTEFGDKIFLEYNQEGRLSKAVSELTGDEATFSYEGDLLRSATNKYGTTSFTYSSAAGFPALASVTDIDGTIHTLAYDSEGRLASVDGNSYSYSATTVSATNSSGTSTISYSSDGKVTQLSTPRGGWSVSRSSAGFGIASSSGKYAATVTKNNDGTLTVSDATGYSVSIKVDENGNATEITDKKGFTTKYEWDSKSSNTRITHADNTSERFAYNPKGQLISSWDRMNRETKYYYDGRGNTVRIEYPDSYVVERFFDSKENLVEIKENGQSTKMTYTNAGELASVTYPDHKTIRYGYDSQGRVISVTDPEQNVTGYGYDAKGDISQVLYNGSLVSEYEYSTDGWLLSQENANSTKTEYSYSKGLLDSITITTQGALAAASSTLSDISYIYDSDGLIAQAGDWSYEYDQAGRLAQAVSPSGEITYKFDSAGNRELMTSGSSLNITYTSNNLNQYTSIGDDSLFYDKNGNLVSRTANGATTSYSYDPLGRLIEVIMPNNDVWEYGYDSFGNRSSVSINSSETKFVYSPIGLGMPLAEYKPDNTVVRYIQDGSLIAQAMDNGGLYFYSYNHLGSTLFITGPDGGIANSYSYTPDGVIASSSETIANHYAYAGQHGIADDRNGLAYSRARYLDLSAGRFISPDPLGQASDLNLYSFAANNPANYVDVTGEDFEIPKIGSNPVPHSSAPTEAQKLAAELAQKKALENNAFDDFVSKKAQDDLLDEYNKLQRQRRELEESLGKKAQKNAAGNLAKNVAKNSAKEAGKAALKKQLLKKIAKTVG